MLSAPRQRKRNHVTFYMLHSPQRDPRVEIVADQLKQVSWIYGYTYVPSEGYRLDWSPQGCQRMMLLQMALKNSRSPVLELDQLTTKDAQNQEAIGDFWNACVAQLELSGTNNSLDAFVEIIKSWKPRD